MRSSKAELAVTYEGDGVIFREMVCGAMHVEIDTFEREFDFTPLLKGLPDDMDPAPHWGYVFKGTFRFQYKDREEVYNTGDVFYAEPWHTAKVDAGTEFVMFSPEEEDQESAAVKLRHLAAMLEVR
ncbi:MAG: cupin domain-containing protein [Halobacteriota archaeon]